MCDRSLWATVVKSERRSSTRELPRVLRQTTTQHFAPVCVQAQDCSMSTCLLSCGSDTEVPLLLILLFDYNSYTDMDAARRRLAKSTSPGVPRTYTALAFILAHKGRSWYVLESNRTSPLALSTHCPVALIVRTYRCPQGLLSKQSFPQKREKH